MTFIRKGFSHVYVYCVCVCFMDLRVGWMLHNRRQERREKGGGGGRRRFARHCLRRARRDDAILSKLRSLCLYKTDGRYRYDGHKIIAATCPCVILPSRDKRSRIKLTFLSRSGRTLLVAYIFNPFITSCQSTGRMLTSWSRAEIDEFQACRNSLVFR